MSDRAPPGRINSHTNLQTWPTFPWEELATFWLEGLGAEDGVGLGGFGVTADARDNVGEPPT